MKPYNKDIEFGEENEKSIKPIIEKFLNCDLKTTEGYNTFDYISEGIYIELKSRRVRHNRYPTTIIGYNKIIESLELMRQGNDIYYFFKFTDGLYYYKLDDRIYKYDVLLGGRNDRGKNEYKKYCYIPVEDLKRIKIT